MRSKPCGACAPQSQPLAGSAGDEWARIVPPTEARDKPNMQTTLSTTERRNPE